MESQPGDCIVSNTFTLPNHEHESLTVLGEASLKKNEKIWDNVPIRVDPPSDIWDIFEFGTFLKNVDPPPL